MSDVALKSISIIIGLFFVFFGILKVVPLFSQDLFHELQSLFEKSAKVFPLQSLTGWRPDAGTMRRMYGSVEMVCGVVLMVGCDNSADIANIILTLLLFFSLYVSWALGEGLKEASHAIVLGLVLTCRFVIRLQTLQANENQGNGYAVDQTKIDKEFQNELRRKIASLRETVKETQEALNSKEQGLKEGGKGAVGKKSHPAKHSAKENHKKVD